MLPNLSVASQ